MSLEHALSILNQIKAIKRVPLSAQFRKPQLATLSPDSPPDLGWLFENKFDGYRIIAVKNKARVKLYSRNGLDWTHRFASVAAEVAGLPAQSLVLDGEIVVLDKAGESSFSALQTKLSETAPTGFTYILFDLIYADGFDLRELPLIMRKKLLDSLTDIDAKHALIQVSQVWRKGGEKLLAMAKKRGGEGIIAKKAQAPYRHERTNGWLKIKATRQDEFLIAGYSAPAGARVGFGALLLGYYDDKKNLIYAGRVGTGFTDNVIRKLHPILNKLKINSSPFKEKLTGLEKRGVQFVKPRLIAQVKYANWTGDSRLRHAVFLGMREDKLTGQIQKPV